MRTELFVKFTKLFLDASRWISYSGKVSQGSLGYYFLKSKHLVLMSAKNKMLDEKLETIDTGYHVHVRINRRKA